MTRNVISGVNLAPRFSSIYGASSQEVYTRPDVLVWTKRKYKVPEILKTGNHAKINEWKTAKRAE